MHSQYTLTTRNFTFRLTITTPLSVTDECFNAVHRWLTLNGLALNPDKSEAIVVDSGARSRQESTISSVSLPYLTLPYLTFEVDATRGSVQRSGH